MHKPFVLIPEWLDPTMETSMDYTQRTFLTHSMDGGLKDALAFQLLCFESLYRLGLSDRQVVEVTAVTILLHKKFGYVTLVPITECRVKEWKDKNKNQPGPRWFRIKRNFYWAFDDTTEFFREWLALNLSENDPESGIGRMFWSGNPEWALIFLGGDLGAFNLLTEMLKVVFAQHCFKLPITGVWGKECRAICKSFQEKFPKKLIPWKTGKLDGFTYRILTFRWKRKMGLDVKF